MSKTVKSILALGFIAVVAACAQPAEEEFVVVEPVTTEPVQTGKYKKAFRGLCEAGGSARFATACRAWPL